jgi:mannosyltransferase OCH1-like enzyme
MNKVILIIIILVVIIYFINNQKFYEHLKYKPIIPKKIYITYKTKNIPSYVISNWKKLYPDYEIILYDNDDCLKFLKNEYGQDYVDIFNYIKDGPIKADFWRACILYKYGGIYTDIDIKPYVSIHDILEEDVIFLTCTSMIKNQINPHFIYSVPGHVILEKTVNTYANMYMNKVEYDYWTWSIVFIMNNVFLDVFKKYLNEDGIYYDDDNNKYQILKEIFPSDTDKQHYCKYKDKKILDNRYEEYNNHQFIEK